MSFSIEEAVEHLRRADGVLAAVMERAGPYQRRPAMDGFSSLMRTILFQQLAGPAARAIQRRLYALYGEEERPPTARQLLATSDEQFRAAGVSRQKTAYLRDLALRVEEGSLDLEGLALLPDEEVVRAITAVKGLGEWSAHMYLMFQLGRPDVLPVGDLGVRNGMRLAYGLEQTPTPAQARVIGAPWAPFRSIGSWYMWRVTEPVMPAI